MLKLKVKKLNSKKQFDFIGMAIKENTARTRIYLHRVNEEGVEQWYESKQTFAQSTALEYFYKGFYKVVFYSRPKKGIQISEVKDWF